MGFWGSLGSVLRLTLALLLLASGGCARSEWDSLFGGTCTIRSDQQRSFMGKNTAFPIQVMVDDAFSKSEQTAISKAIDKWNALGNDVAGHQFFSITVSQIPEAAKSFDINSCQNSPNDGSDATHYYLVKETNFSRWKRDLGLNDSTPGVTLRCDRDKRLVQQTVIIQTKVTDPLQFESIVLHELGHSLGLDHSCNNKAATDNFISCDQLPAEHPYRQAVLYPSLRARASISSTPEIRQELQQNDRDRTQCLYSP